MMWFLTFIVGLSSVVQAGLNRQMTDPWGLPAAILLNAVMFLIASALYFVAAYYQWVQLPDYLSQLSDLDVVVVCKDRTKKQLVDERVTSLSRPHAAPVSLIMVGNPHADAA